ncbi:hypothetical protein RINTHH_14530 [Richelia intracellularis HH01]|uniref:Uncharacterized protein n=1 Tax=Richelia intracellularis HH01 TaxID=1165094 RepID=M1X0P0_9NOST|nr:hypothetical protein RINTHH_14530 [Richelia intracellularis HH01]
MRSKNHTRITIQEAKKIFNKFNCLDISPSIQTSERRLICQSLLVIVNSSDYQIPGIDADKVE